MLTKSISNNKYKHLYINYNRVGKWSVAFKNYRKLVDFIILICSSSPMDGKAYHEVGRDYY